MSITEFKKVKASDHSIKMRKPIFGIGINDAWYTVCKKTNNKQYMCKSYKKWKGMLRRCYDKEAHVAQPTYKDCSVCEEWLRFSAFNKWFNENYVNGYELDKDIKVKGNKKYSPETCLFVPKSINNLLTDRGGRSKNQMAGTSKRKNGSFISSITIDSKSVHLGVYDNEYSAHKAYKKAKNEEIIRKCEQFPEFSKYLKQYLYKSEM